MMPVVKTEDGVHYRAPVVQIDGAWVYVQQTRDGGIEWEDINSSGWQPIGDGRTALLIPAYRVIDVRI